MNIKEIIYNSLFTPVRFVENLLESPAIILIYHRVADLEDDSQQLAVKPRNFSKQIHYLKNNFNLLTVEEFAGIIINQKKLPQRSILLTFDDGYADNYLNAVPILESNKVQSLFYITTSMLNNEEETWWDKLEQIFILNSRLPSKLSVEINEKQYIFDTSSGSQIEKTYKALHQILKYLKIDERIKVIKQLAERKGTDTIARPTHRFLTSGELKKMSLSKSVIIGAHTHTHTPLSILRAEEQRDEITTSVRLLEEITGKKVEHFSYPFGLKKDYNKDTINICKEIGFKFVCANYYSQVHSWTDRYQLPRILIRDWEFETFKTSVNRYFRY